MIQGRITSKNEQLVIAGIESLPARVEAALATGLARGLLGAVAIAQREFLSGPRPAQPQRVTGRLQGGVQSEVTSAPGRITGRMGNAVKYAAFHEFGFHGTINVRAHSRVLENFGPSGQALEVDSRVISGVRQTRKAVAKRQPGGFVAVQFVKAHRRKVDYAGKPFIRPALEQAVPMILGEIRKELA